MNFYKKGIVIPSKHHLKVEAQQKLANDAMEEKKRVYEFYIKW